mgnify:CR=1 FL=1
MREGSGDESKPAMICAARNKTDKSTNNVYDDDVTLFDLKTQNESSFKEMREAGHHGHCEKTDAIIERIKILR